MSERVQLQNAKKEFELAIRVLNRKLNVLAKANIKYASSKITEVGNSVLETYKEMKSKMSIYLATKSIERAEKKQEKETEINQMMAEMMEEEARHERTKEHVDAMKEILKEQDREQREYQAQKRKQRLIQIRYGAVQKVKRTFSKLGNVKNVALQNLSKSRNNIDLKISNAFEKAKLNGLKVETKIVETASGVKNYASNQIATFAAWRYESKLKREQRKEEKEAENNQMMAEMMEEEARHERTKEHVEAMKEILKEQDREQRLYQAQQRKQRLIQIRYGAVQKVKRTFSKLGNVKNVALQNLSKSRNNIDLKISNAFEKAKLSGLKVETKIVETASGVKNYASDQIATFAAWRYESKLKREQRKEEKEAENNQMMAEMMEEEARHERTKEHVDAMKEIIREQDRQTLYEEQQRIQEQIRIQIEQLQQSKNDFLGVEEQKGIKR